MIQSVVLLRVPTVLPLLSTALPICPPIGLAYMAASMRAAGIDVSCVDAVGEAPFQMRPIKGTEFLSLGLSTDQIVDRVSGHYIIGISIIFSNAWPYAREIIRNIRRRNPRALLVCGGEHVTSIPEFCLEDCPEIDVCVLGEGEETIVSLVQARTLGHLLEKVDGIVFRSGDKIIRTPRRARIKNLDEMPWPAWNLLPIENYLANGLGFGINPGRTIPMVATRGCPFSCTFCSSPVMWTTRWGARDPEKVLDEIQHYIEKYQVQNIDFYDLTAVLRRDWIVKFCQGVIERNLKFTWQMPAGTRSESLDFEVLELLKKTGVNHLTYNPESGSAKTLKEIKKKVSLEKISGSIEAALKVGINVKVNFIIGFPSESRLEIFQTFIFVLKIAWFGASDVIINAFMPYPGSELFEQLFRNGKIRNHSTGEKVGRLDDQYFQALAITINKTESYSNSIGDFELTVYKLIGMILFYGMSFLRRPQRFFKLIYNVRADKEETRLEASLIQLKKRLFEYR